MNFATLRDAIKLCGDAKLTCCIWGHRGIGKSATVKQLVDKGHGHTAVDKDGKTVNLPVGFIDFRLGQIEATDIRGALDKVLVRGRMRTMYCTPVELPVADMTPQQIYAELQAIADPVERAQRELELQPHYNEGYLFLDEPNRAQDDVMQAIFQLIYDRRIGNYKLPDGWRIVMAANFMGGSAYMTNNFTDEAFLDRFCHLQLSVNDTTLDEWMAYMVNSHGEHAAPIMDFCASNMAYLLGKVEGTLGFTIQPSPRSWEFVTGVCKVAAEKGYSQAVVHEVVAGLVGMECAASFGRYSCPVKPKDLLKDGVNPHKDLLLGLERGQLMGLSWGLVSLVKDRLEDQKVVNVCLDYAETILRGSKVNDKDVVISFCRALIGNEGPAVACLTNKELAGILGNLASEQMGFFFRELQKRPDLHKMVSDVGWGNVSSQPTATAKKKK